MPSSDVEADLTRVLKSYSASFRVKVHAAQNVDSDLLMDVFGITPQLKAENKQYWGRELGMCWQRLVTELGRTTASFRPPLRVGADEVCDLILGSDAIDTKYRVGSGDSGTLKKFRAYGLLLREKGFTPVLLFLRTDNLPAAITACRSGSWVIYQADETFDYLKARTKFDLKNWLVSQRDSSRFD